MKPKIPNQMYKVPPISKKEMSKYTKNDDLPKIPNSPYVGIKKMLEKKQG